MINAWDLPEAADGRTPSPMTVEFQLRRLNRIASALWEARALIGDDPAIRIEVDLDSGYAQIHLAAYQAGRDVAEQLAGRLGWDVEADVRPTGINRQHWWHGLIGGFRAQLVWIEVPELVDSQGRDQLPADVGIGDSAADAEHVRLQGIARAASGFEVVPVQVLNESGHDVVFTAPQDGQQYLVRAGSSDPIPFRTEGPGQ